MKILHHIHRQPEHHRERIRWAIVGFVGLALVTVWVLTYPTFGHGPKDTTLFDAMQRGIQDSVSRIRVR